MKLGTLLKVINDEEYIILEEPNKNEKWLTHILFEGHKADEDKLLEYKNYNVTRILSEFDGFQGSNLIIIITNEN